MYRGASRDPSSLPDSLPRCSILSFLLHAPAHYRGRLWGTTLKCQTEGGTRVLFLGFPDFDRRFTAFSLCHKPRYREAAVELEATTLLLIFFVCFLPLSHLWDFVVFGQEVKPVFRVCMASKIIPVSYLLNFKKWCLCSLSRTVITLRC